MDTRVGIIGAGAIGSIVGGLLTKAGHDVALIDQWPDHVHISVKSYDTEWAVSLAPLLGMLPR